MKPEIIIIVLIVGSISAFFLIRGIKGLFQKKMLVKNPLAKTAPSSPSGIIFNILQDKVSQDYYVPEGFIDRNPMIEITGKDLLIRASFNILFGLIALFILIIFLNPELFNLTMDFIFSILDKA
jgi:hypothetical protein